MTESTNKTYDNYQVMQKTKVKLPREKRINVDLGDLRREAKARCGELEITLQEGIRRAVAQWVRLVNRP